LKGKTRIKELRKAYKEACNCGYNGTFVKYIMDLGVKVGDLENEKT
jgi:hypothetical protein